MLADPLRGRFTGVSTDALVMPALAGASIQIATHRLADMFNMQMFFHSGVAPGFFLQLCFFAIVSHIAFSFSYQHRCRARSRSMLLVTLFGACAIMTYLLAFYLVMSHRAIPYARVLITYFALAFLYQALRYKLRSAYLMKHQEAVMILGTGREAQKVWKHIRIQCDRMVVFKGFVGESGTKDAAPDIMARTVCTLDSLKHFLHTTVVDTLVLTANSAKDLGFASESIRIAQECGIRLLCVNEHYEDLPTAPGLHTVSETYVDFERATRLQQTSRIIKSTVDRSLAAVALLFLTPVALPLLLLYRLLLGESALVSQSIYGYHRHSFTMWNIRTEFTQPSSDKMSKASYSLSSLRETVASRIGRFLQVSGLSHAPRLWNVCTGDMSLVGPTPIPRTQTPLVGSGGLLRRYTMRPGLCWPEPDGIVSTPATVNDEVTISYLQHWSLTLDWNTFTHWIRSRTHRTIQAFSTSILTNNAPLTDRTQRAR